MSACPFCGGLTSTAPSPGRSTVSVVHVSKGSVFRGQGRIDPSLLARWGRQDPIDNDLARPSFLWELLQT